MLTIAVFILYVLYLLPFFTKESIENSSKNSSDSIRNQSTPFRSAFINNDTLLTYYEYYIDIQEEFDLKKNKAQHQLQNRTSKLEEDIFSAEKRAKAGLMSANEIEQTQEKIAKQQKNLQIYSQTLSEGLAEEEKIQREKLLIKISDFIRTYNKKAKYDLIFNYAQGGTLWHGDKGMDITQEILKELNKIYIKEKQDSQ